MALSFKNETRNAILSSIKAENFKRISDHLELTEMPLGQMIYQPNEKITHVYFPETSVISVVTYLENGACVETGIIGNEGMSGIEILLAENSSPREAMVQHPGFGKKMKVEKFKELLESNAFPREILMKYVYSFIRQISQNPACLAFHKIEKRLARWLLMFADRAGGNELNLTQEFIAVMLGVQRPSVSKCAAELQKQKLINYNRGRINLLDRHRLMETSCECYKAIKESSHI